MRDIKKILMVANYIIKNKATVKDVMEEFNLSKKTVLNYVNVYLKKMSETDPIYLELYNEVKKTMKNNEYLGKIKGGKTGARGYHYTDFEIMEVAETIIERNMTLKEASEYFRRLQSGLYNAVCKEAKRRSHLFSNNQDCAHKQDAGLEYIRLKTTFRKKVESLHQSQQKKGLLPPERHLLPTPFHTRKKD